jgi:hypothetical protein
MMAIMACSLAMIAIMIGVIGRSWGGITLVHPQVLYEKWLHRQEWEFRKDMVYFAAEHFEQNFNLVNRKGRLVTIMTLFFALKRCCSLCGSSLHEDNDYFCCLPLSSLMTFAGLSVCGGGGGGGGVGCGGDWVACATENS